MKTFVVIVCCSMLQPDGRTIVTSNQAPVWDSQILYSFVSLVR